MRLGITTLALRCDKNSFATLCYSRVGGQYDPPPAPAKNFLGDDLGTVIVWGAGWTFFPRRRRCAD